MMMAKSEVWSKTENGITTRIGIHKMSKPEGIYTHYISRSEMGATLATFNTYADRRSTREANAITRSGLKRRGFQKVAI